MADDRRFNKRGRKSTEFDSDVEKVKEILRSSPTLTSEEVTDVGQFSLSRRTISNKIKKAKFSRKVVKKINFNNFICCIMDIYLK